MSTKKQTAAEIKQQQIRDTALRRIAKLQKMSMDELRQQWRELFGKEPPDYKKGFMMRRLSYRIQEIYHGGTSKFVHHQLECIAKKDPVATIKKKVPDARPNKAKSLEGTRFVRVWKNQRYEVIAREKGFEMNGKMYRSLSGVAYAITGRRWNGKVFFGLKKWNGKTEGFKNV